MFLLLVINLIIRVLFSRLHKATGRYMKVGRSASNKLSVRKKKKKSAHAQFTI